MVGRLFARWGSHALALDNLWLDGDAHDLAAGVSANHVHEASHRERAHVGLGDGHGRERRADKRRGGGVVKAYDGNVVRDRVAVVLERADAA